MWTHLWATGPHPPQAVIVHLVRYVTCTSNITIWGHSSQTFPKSSTLVEVCHFQGKRTALVLFYKSIWPREGCPRSRCNNGSTRALPSLQWTWRCLWRDWGRGALPDLVPCHSAQRSTVNTSYEVLLWLKATLAIPVVTEHGCWLSMWYWRLSLWCSSTLWIPARSKWHVEAREPRCWALRTGKNDQWSKYDSPAAW